MQSPTFFWPIAGLCHSLRMAVAPHCAVGALVGAGGVAVTRSQRHYVAVTVEFGDQPIFCWFNDPVESTVGGRGRRSGNFVPPEDARLLRETVRQDSFRLLAGDDINRSSTADILDYLRGISWDQVGVGAECVSPIFVLTSERQVNRFKVNRTIVVQSPFWCWALFSPRS